ncbi:quinon protein alcohol dehydrogenase-like superfamily [Gorgonomyces haynaldii]|nr:quinon protein alcohol dehydrogenase-like superfamily [Gorgonomyces haynaldii]
MFNAIACERVNQGIDIHGDVMAYCAGPYVGLYSLTDGTVKLLKAHNTKTTCVLFLDQYLVSGSKDGTLIVWKQEKDSYSVYKTLAQHQTSIVALGVLKGLATNGKRFICSSDSKSNVMLWSLAEELSLMDQWSVGPHLVTAIDLEYLPQTQIPILFVGTTDKRLRVYTFDEKLQMHLSLKGHTDWIRSIKTSIFTDTHDKDYGFQKGDLMIASASQDKYIRIWRLTTSTDLQSRKNEEFERESEIMAALKEMHLENEGFQLSTKAHVIQVQSKPYTLLLDAVLMGHDDWVHTVQWQPVMNGHQPMTLISSSADKSLIIWAPDQHSASWVPSSRLGEVGGTTLGFYGAMFSDDGKRVYSNGYHGAIHGWELKESWEPLVGISGHSRSVEQLRWDPTGTYLLSCSLDQTTRIYTYWNHSMHEIARTQIHGYDMHCFAFVDKYQYCSGADEKVIRVFTGPKNFAETLENITGIKEKQEILENRPQAANLPALGLSNKAFDAKTEGDSAYAPAFQSQAFKSPPFEEDLLQNTLWPEVDKLYGHGYEIICLETHGDLLASTCKATKQEHAAVRLWSTKTGKEVTKPLMYHQLTVTCLSFSNSGKYLLSGGRDRGWCVFDISDLSETKIVASCEKAHARIIWGLKFSADDRYFVTGSRDKTLKFWLDHKLIGDIKVDQPVTCLDLVRLNGIDYLAVGCEEGGLFVYALTVTDHLEIKSQISLDALSHVGVVKSVSWKGNTLATGGEDGAIKVFEVTL